MSTLAPPRVEPVSDDRAHISRVPYLPGLDGMRALAVVAVMVYHANSDWLPGGFLGVEMFFVISGYLITLLLISERERTYRISLRHFWLRRARRLLPALFTMMLLVTVWTAIFKDEALGALRGDVIAGFFYVSNWYQIWEGLGYTAAGDFAPLRHLWSLAVEEQFYLFWPVVMIFLLGRNGTRQVAAVSRWLFVAAVVITVAVALLYYPGPIAEPDVTPDAYWWLGDRPIAKIDTLYLGTISRLSGIMLGSAFAMVWRPLAIVRGPLRSKGRLFDGVALVSIVGFGWLCWNTYLVTPSGADPFLFRGGMFLAGLATLAIIAAVTHRGAYANRLLGNPLFRWVGTRSYGLYLYHWPIYQMIRGVAGNKLTLGEFVFALLLTAIVTEVSYRLVETPIRLGRFSVRWRGIYAGARRGPKLAATGAIAVAAVGGLFVGAVLMTAPLQQNEIAQALDAGEEFTTDLLAVDAIPVASTSTTSSTTTVAPATTVAEVLVPVLDPVGSVVGEVVAVDHRGADHRGADDRAADHRAADHRAARTGGAARGRDQPRGAGPLAIPPTVSGFPLVALGDSVMLGAAEELQARGFQVDALQSRQMNTFVPTMQALKDNGTFGSVVVVHLGTNGGFSQETLDEHARHGGRRPGRAPADRQGRPGLDRRQQREAPCRPRSAPQRDRRRLGGAVGELSGTLLLRRRDPPHPVGPELLRRRHRPGPRPTLTPTRHTVPGQT
jgi:peptidoglycan/LPS O-acetylase OafA/YrhL